MNTQIEQKYLVAAAEFLKCIAHPQRLKILEPLDNEELNVSQLVKSLKISQSVTSDHLRLMQARGILNFKRKGRNIYYSIAMDEIRNILKCVRSYKLIRKNE